jgi:small subunit ribosomal protein S20
MANIKSQIKRNKQNAQRALRNRSLRSALKTSTRRFREAEGDAVVERAREASRALDKAASKGAIHKRTAARRKSRLARAANRAAASA